jgi:hypothetical protein
LTGLSIACQRKDEQVSGVFFNVDSLLNAQIIYLSKRNSDLKKNAFMDGKTDSVFLKDLDTTSWKKEL